MNKHTKEFIVFLNDMGAKGQIEVNPSKERINEIKKAMKQQEDIISWNKLIL